METRSRTNARARLGAAVALLGCIAWLAPARGATAPGAMVPAPASDRAAMEPPFPQPLFDQPLVLVGSFGDHRSNHFHAGLDLSTGGVVGRAAHAPMDGHVVRVRTSGAGYGRSLYLETADGRLLVFGHLDGFAEPIASFIARIQDSTGVYEQDVWTDPRRFPVRAGEIVGWTGRSGTGTPHLHFEVRRVDTALHPLRAGLAVPDTSTPRIERVTLVAADDGSRVWLGGHAPQTRLMLGPRDTATVLAAGTLRVVVEALDQNGKGGWDIEPWRIRESVGDEWTEVRFDSASWATDMPQSDYVYDSGRWTEHGATSVLLAAPGGFRPKVLHSSRSLSEPAGLVQVSPGVTVAIRIDAEDLAGHVGSRTVTVRGAQPMAPLAASPVRRPTLVANLERTDVAREVVIPGAIRIRLPAHALFEPTRLSLTKLPVPSAAGMTAVTPAVLVDPPRTPLAVAVDVLFPLPEDTDFRHCGVFHDVGDGWEFVGNHYVATTDTLWGSSRRLGKLCVFRDTQPPSITLLAPPRAAAPSPYPRWSLEAHVVDRGSGVAALPTHFEIDGHPVPTEWDDVESTMRWRPLHPPAPGRHQVLAVAIDHCGNERRTPGSFVIK